MKHLLLAAVAAATLPLASGCGVLYSRQDFGSARLGAVLSEGASRADAFVNLGSPNSIYERNGMEILVYKNLKGRNYLGLYSTVRRTDTIVIIDANGQVASVQQVEVGSGSTVISPPGLDATHPVRTKELYFEPENFGYEDAK
ncbi:MAG: hypothetical protein SF028_13455 [Candidatus Sumerlaeia bacterium]|nr:hypothetical protein [Candidatus Sumerlaeia bacterium]